MRRGPRSRRARPEVGPPLGRGCREVEQDEQIVEVFRVARPVFDQLGDARRFGEQQRQRGGMLGRRATL